MQQEKPEPNRPFTLVGPYSYLEAGDRLVNQDKIGFSFEEVLMGVTGLFLQDYSSHSKQAKLMRQVSQAIGKEGVWGFDNVYWQRGIFYMKRDPFGLGSKLDPPLMECSTVRTSIIPENPDNVVDILPGMFGYFKPEEFSYSPLANFLDRVAPQLVKLASKIGTGIRVSGLELSRGGLARTVCSLEFAKGSLHINLAEDERRKHYALGKRPKKSGRKRF